MIKRANIPYFLIGFSVVLGIKYCLRFMELHHLDFLLFPTTALVEFLSGTQAVFIPEEGYLFAGKNFIIDSSCSGINLWLIASSMLIYLFSKINLTSIKKIALLLPAFAIAWLITIVSNGSRIYISSVFQDQLTSVFNVSSHAIHESLGVVTNLSFLIITYFLIEYLLTNQSHYEKAA
ncbi:exosortase K [Mangrovivirga sp. M17]|uniref:Exosortase K n=1 Tax=Mangrovivirga halotolerans TaxID=2993936 RepID=A0ABT3RPX0_9BACT|nr:exosortase K [Mangrovivirga halotolerans]MCX2743655.1 exosortase K [Mangrovivirga halotolerans]